MGYVYMVQSADMAPNVCKIGRGGSMDRVKSYGSNAKILGLFQETEEINKERELKLLFKEKFQLIRGKEYFRGDNGQMLRVFVKAFDPVHNDQKKANTKINLLPRNNGNQEKAFNPQTKRWSCSECHRTFADKWGMTRHQKKYCPVLKKGSIKHHKASGDNLACPLKIQNGPKNVAGSLENLSAMMQILITQNAGLESKLESKLETKLKATEEELHAKMAKYDSLVLANCNQNDNKSVGDLPTKEAEEPKIDIVCLAKGDYIKKLIELHDGDEEKAMNYIKNVGIATDFLEGDFRLIKKIYFDGKKKSQFPIRIKDYKRNKLEYLEENGEWILDIRGEIVGKRLCENIVSTLLIANTQFNEVIINEPDEDRKELLLDLFQINKTQAHIMRLLERKTQGKLSRRVAEFINYCTEVHAETGNLDNVKKAYE